MFELIKKASQSSITLSVYFDGLRFADFDAVIFYSFLEVGKFIDNAP